MLNTTCLKCWTEESGNEDKSVMMSVLWDSVGDLFGHTPDQVCEVSTQNALKNNLCFSLNALMLLYLQRRTNI